MVFYSRHTIKYNLLDLKELFAGRPFSNCIFLNPYICTFLIVSGDTSFFQFLFLTVKPNLCCPGDQSYYLFSSRFLVAFAGTRGP